MLFNSIERTPRVFAYRIVCVIAYTTDSNDKITNFIVFITTIRYIYIHININAGNALTSNNGTNSYQLAKHDNWIKLVNEWVSTVHIGWLCAGCGALLCRMNLQLHPFQQKLCAQFLLFLNICVILSINSSSNDNNNVNCNSNG